VAWENLVPRRSGKKGEALFQRSAKKKKVAYRQKRRVSRQTEAHATDKKNES